MRRGSWTLGAIALLAGGCRSTEPPARTHTPGTEVHASPAGLELAGPLPAGLPPDADFWRMSRDPKIVKEGQAAFTSSFCQTCHGLALTGGAGPNLVDQRWLHGGTPREVYATIARGVPSKGMPTWGPVLNPKMITSLVAYIFSYHRNGEPIEFQAAFTPITPSYDPP